jgi:hypothetical protein
VIGEGRGGLSEREHQFVCGRPCDPLEAEQAPGREHKPAWLEDPAPLVLENPNE